MMARRGHFEAHLPGSVPAISAGAAEVCCFLDAGCSPGSRPLGCQAVAADADAALKLAGAARLPETQRSDSTFMKVNSADCPAA